MVKFVTVDKVFGRSKDNKIQNEEQLEQLVKALNFRNSCSRLAIKRVKNGNYVLFENRTRMLLVFTGNTGVSIVLQNNRVGSEDFYTVNPFFLDRMVSDGLLNPDYSLKWSELDG